MPGLFKFFYYFFYATYQMDSVVKLTYNRKNKVFAQTDVLENS